MPVLASSHMRSKNPNRTSLKSCGCRYKAKTWIYPCGLHIEKWRGEKLSINTPFDKNAGSQLLDKLKIS